MKCQVIFLELTYFRHKVSSSIPYVSCHHSFYFKIFMLGSINIFQLQKFGDISCDVKRYDSWESTKTREKFSNSGQPLKIGCFHVSDTMLIKINI